MKTRRQHVLRIRLSDVEWAHLQNVFPKRAVGTSLRALALDQPVPQRDEAVDVRRDLTRHLARIGNNLNQVARGINRAVLTGDRRGDNGNRHRADCDGRKRFLLAGWNTNLHR